MSDAYFIPPGPEPMGPCRNCPGDCPIEDHFDNNDGEPAGCEQHPDCDGYEEYTYEDHLADEADRVRSLQKEGAW